ncbi:hypothetical protein [Absidia glauca]|uniref:Uncharacterized protein n=1 Tax=Absidia glauca TaxID=4829 RepID=A0A168NRV6_ABSGL|nr:hypothetical protein [Absidia glauca]
MMVRQMDSEQQLIQIDHPKKYHRWLTCFAFVFRRSKSQPSSSSSSLISPITTITTTTSSSSATAPSTPSTHPLDQLWCHPSDDDGDDTTSEKPHPPSSSSSSASLPSSPISSLSPPPRHTMVRQNRTRSLTPLDHSTLFTLGRSPPPPTRQSQPAVLRLSLNVDQHVSDKEDSDAEDDDPTGLFFKRTTIISTTGQDSI